MDRALGTVTVAAALRATGCRVEIHDRHSPSAGINDHDALRAEVGHEAAVAGGESGHRFGEGVDRDLSGEGILVSMPRRTSIL